MSQRSRSEGAAGVALVTGAARRIGLSIARKLAAAGYEVVLHASEASFEEARSAAAAIVAQGGRAAAIAADLADAAQTEGLIAAATERAGPLTLLVNNASIFEADAASDFLAGRFDEIFAVNLRAPCMLAARFAAQAPSGASVVNIVDQRVLNLSADCFSYTLSKAALWAATQTMAQSFAPGVRVNAVGPGPVLPNSRDGEAGFRREVERAPLRRAVDPADVADAVLYLAGARNVTGQMIAVDAGQHLG
ncbi:SDR family oxidoreductase [Methylocella sp.]|uniref:SDR family oxidoreductase n=1 Tax=Methylocella sp. TaxID=1978226 RepID=UPI0037851FF3